MVDPGVERLKSGGGERLRPLSGGLDGVDEIMEQK